MNTHASPTAERRSERSTRDEIGGGTAVVEIQQLVDELAERLRHSVAVDDPHGHLIASSKHFGDEDVPRVNVVLSRDLDPRVAKYLYSFGIRSATEKVVIPGKDDLGLKARCCYPLRHRRQLLGFIWLIGDHGTDEVIRLRGADRRDSRPAVRGVPRQRGPAGRAGSTAAFPDRCQSPRRRRAA